MKRALCLSLFLVAPSAFARVVPFAPFGDQVFSFVVQNASARHAVGWYTEGPAGSQQSRQLKAVDLGGLTPPIPLPDPPGVTASRGAAAFEEPDGRLRLLEWWTSDGSVYQYAFSPDSGTTWTHVPWAGPSTPRALITGNSAVPFVLALITQEGARYWGLRADGTPLFLAYVGADPRILGSDATGSRFLIAGEWFGPVAAAAPASESSTAGKVAILDLDGRIQPVFDIPGQTMPIHDGWITPDGAIYFNVQNYTSAHRNSVSFWNGGGWPDATELVTSTSAPVFSAPTAGQSGAWIASSESGSVVLRSHSPAGGVVERWRVPTLGTLTALYAGRSADRVIVATKRQRGESEAWGFATWEPGQPPPLLDDVLLNWNGAGIVRIDPDEVALGGVMLLWSGYDYPFDCGECPPPPDPIGLVRVALKQRLVIPAAARARGAQGADWRTDLIVRNPEASAVDVTVRFLPNPGTTPAAPDATLTLAPNETRLVPDVLATLFHLDSGSGALLLVPSGNARIRATSRTYTRSERGTYGMSVDGVDAQNAAWAILPRTIAAGLLGAGFRSNLVAADVSGSGTVLDVLAPPAAPLEASVAPNAQTQLNDLAYLTGAAASDTRSLVLTLRAGAAVLGLIAIDDATNDPSWFGADAIAGDWNFPALVHADGIGGAKWRTDLYLYNPHADARFIGVSSASFMLGPGEARVVRDIVGTVFGATGVVWGEVQSFGVQVTSRVYAENPDGSTYGMVVPPFDKIERAYAYAGWRETLEIVGPVGGAGFRTNLVIFQLDHPGSAHVQILDGSGRELDSLDVSLPNAYRLQIDDLFRTRGLGDGPEVAVIRITVVHGAFSAYATTIDNGTNDPVYFAGALGSH